MEIREKEYLEIQIHPHAKIKSGNLHGGTG